MTLNARPQPKKVKNRTKALASAAFVIGLFGSIFWGSLTLLPLYGFNPFTNVVVSNYVDMMPEKLGKLERVQMGGIVDPYCSGIVFRIEESVSMEIEAKGLAFFADATRSRAKSNWPERESGNYYVWVSTPVPAEWGGYETQAPGIDCTGNDKALTGQITKSSTQSGNYYAMPTKNQQLLILPRERLAVYTERGLWEED